MHAARVVAGCLAIQDRVTDLTLGLAFGNPASRLGFDAMALAQVQEYQDTIAMLSQQLADKKEIIRKLTA